MLTTVKVDEDEFQLTRNVSPTIHDGAELPVCSSKNAPRHWSCDNLDSIKSAELIGQLFEPKFNSTITSVSHAVGIGDV